MNCTKNCVLFIIFIWQHKPLLADDNEIDLKTQWTLVRKFNTGYKAQNDAFAASLDFLNWSDECRRQAITVRMDKLKCAYLFSAHYHFSMVGAIFGAQDERSLKMSWTLFLSESVTMVRSFFAVKAIQIDEIWLVYVHAFTMNKYLLLSNRKRFWNPSIPDIPDIAENMMQQNLFVITELNGYLEKSCDPDNSFSIKSEVRSIEGIRADSVLLNSEYSSSRVHTMILDNKKRLNKLHEQNMQRGLKMYSNWSIDESYLEKAIDNKYDRFLKVFTTFVPSHVDKTDWEILDRAMVPYSNLDFTKNNGLQGLLKFGKLLTLIVDVFRFMLLRPTFKFITALNHMCDEYQNSVVDSYMTQFQSVLPKVIEALNLKDADIFCQLNGNLEKGANHYKQNKDHVFIKLNDEHNRLCAVLNIPQLENAKKIISNEFAIVETVVDKIRGFFRPLELKLYQSYLEFFSCYNRPISFFLAQEH